MSLFLLCKWYYLHHFFSRFHIYVLMYLFCSFWLTSLTFWLTSESMTLSEEAVVHIYNGILLSLNREQNWFIDRDEWIFYWFLFWLFLMGSQENFLLIQVNRTFLWNYPPHIMLQISSQMSLFTWWWCWFILLCHETQEKNYLQNHGKYFLFLEKV